MNYITEIITFDLHSNVIKRTFVNLGDVFRFLKSKEKELKKKDDYIVHIEIHIE